MPESAASLRHPIRSSCLFRIRSPAVLAKVLRVELSFLTAQMEFSAPYNEFDLNGRWIKDPKPGLKKIHKRFAHLLSKIETPEYLHSAVKKRSYVTNSKAHGASTPTVKLDVKKFYPSARAQQVFHFFKDELEWPDHVARLGTHLFTWKGHLPTGGNASPILSFWAYKPMFDQIYDLANQNQCEFSLYVDDMTLTGALASNKLLLDARRIVGGSRLKAHKTHLFKAGQPRVITGVAKTLHGPRLPYKRQRLIAQAEANLRAATTPEEIEKAFRRLIGRVCEALEVDPLTWRPRTERLLTERRNFLLEQGMRGNYPKGNATVSASHRPISIAS